MWSCGPVLEVSVFDLVFGKSECTCQVVRVYREDIALFLWGKAGHFVLLDIQSVAYNSVSLAFRNTIQNMKGEPGILEM